MIQTPPRQALMPACQKPSGLSRVVLTAAACLFLALDWIAVPVAAASWRASGSAEARIGVTWDSNVLEAPVGEPRVAERVARYDSRVGLRWIRSGRRVALGLDVRTGVDLPERVGREDRFIAGASMRVRLLPAWGRLEQIVGYRSIEYRKDPARSSHRFEMSLSLEATDGLWLRAGSFHVSTKPGGPSARSALFGQCTLRIRLRRAGFFEHLRFSGGLTSTCYDRRAITREGRRGVRQRDWRAELHLSAAVRAQRLSGFVGLLGQVRRSNSYGFDSERLALECSGVWRAKEGLFVSFFLDLGTARRREVPVWVLLPSEDREDPELGWRDRAALRLRYSLGSPVSVLTELAWERSEGLVTGERIEKVQAFVGLQWRVSM